MVSRPEHRYKRVPSVTSVALWITLIAALNVTLLPAVGVAQTRHKAGTPTKTSASKLRPGPPPLYLNTPSDALLAGPVKVSLANSEPTDIGITLEKGKKYFLQVSGVGGFRGGEQGCDPLFAFGIGDLPKGYVRPDWSFRLINPDGVLYELARKSAGPPRYNPSHSYGFVIEGTGKPLKALYTEKSKSAYGDNSGSFTIQVFPEPLPVLEWSMAPVTPKPTRAPDADHVE